MTEDEARTKWCPIRVIKVVAHHRKAEPIDRGHELTRCIASDCMMWQWEPIPMGMEDPPRPEELQGHCGLAHMPRYVAMCGGCSRVVALDDTSK